MATYVMCVCDDLALYICVAFAKIDRARHAPQPGTLNACQVAGASLQGQGSLLEVQRAR